MSTVNSNISHGHFKKGGELTTTLQFRRELAQELLANDSVEEDRVEGRPKISCIA